MTNHGPGPLVDVSLSTQLTLVGVTLSGSSVTATAGTCSGPDANLEIQCGLGTLAENSTALVTVSLDVASPGTIALLGQVSTGLGCPAPAHNDADQVVIYVEAAPEAEGPGKGCGCHTSPRGTLFLLPLILIGLLGRRFFQHQ